MLRRVDQPAIEKASEADHTPWPGRRASHPMQPLFLEAGIHIAFLRVKLAHHRDLTRPSSLDRGHYQPITMRSFPTEYLVLVRTSAKGPVVGHLGERPIAEEILDEWGRAYVYCGLAPKLASGAINLKLIRTGEWIVEPGLLYRLKGEARADNR